MTRIDILYCYTGVLNPTALRTQKDQNHLQFCLSEWNTERPKPFKILAFLSAAGLKNTYLESNDVWPCVSRSVSSANVLAKLPLFLEFTPARTEPSSAVFWVSRELVDTKLPCL